MQILNAVIEVEGSVAEILSSILDNEHTNLDPSIGDDNSKSVDRELIGEDLNNILMKAIKIKRNIHNHDMIRQIGDKTYMMKRTLETAEDILDMLTEGEGKGVNAALGESIGGDKRKVVKYLLDCDALSFVMADAVRNANKYSQKGHVPTLSIDYIGGHLVVKCKNKTDPARHKPLTKEEVQKIFARESYNASRGYISSNLGLPAAYDAAKYFPGTC